ncbi:hypothetical protein [Paractinoplanes atraurantiacus]|uniref:Uncharacterized protein n=1 Tax=Paractinoplanes atraurantiacus TaxID=1036182 RepID=A0A285K7H4_9ACTN|nr:hypothetical protein [Actinoplanes atraurantiacus]SNY67446.1 hypothetical protein SAMN05421748_131115 [Actinoplanes atraurantiacus]
MYALYAWGNFINEAELDRLPAWIDPAVLSGERAVVDDNLTIADEGPLLVDGAGTLFEVDGELVEGRALAGRDLSGSRWRVARIRVATDGTREDALRITDEIEEVGDIDVDTEPENDPLLAGQAVTVWADEHGQWDLALVKL